MFEHINGKLIEANPAYAIIETAGIGYFINISLYTYTAINGKDDCTLFLHQVIREDTNAIYGFYEKGERQIFRYLISVNGIGANTARMMLSAQSPPELQKAILEDDLNLLKSIKGIGVKTAQRIIIELKDKLNKTNIQGEISTYKDNTITDEALSALIMLGFSKKSVEKVLEKLISSNKGASVEEIVKQALKFL